MSLPLEKHLSFGIEALHRPPPPDAPGPWQPSQAELREKVARLERCGYDTVWAGDHLSFYSPQLDPLAEIAQAAAMSSSLRFGTGIYLVPLRHPGPIAKQVATVDHLAEGRFVFGVGVGGENPREFDLAGVPVGERGPRLTEAIEVMRKLWTGQPVSHQGRFWQFDEVTMAPAPRQPGGPPIWAGGRSDGALRRIGRMLDGWMAYVVTPEKYAEGLEKIEAAAEAAGRRPERFATAHLLFARIDESRERALDVAATALTKRYGMDFRKPADRYAALGTPEQVAETIAGFHEAGVRHVSLSFQGPYDEFDAQTERFAAEVMPLLRHLSAAA